MENLIALDFRHLPQRKKRKALSRRPLYPIVALMSGVACLVGSFFFQHNIVLGQFKPVAVTLNNGLRYEGDIFELSELGPYVIAGSGGVDAAAMVVINDGLKYTFLNRNQIANANGVSNMAAEVHFDIFQRKSRGTAGNGGFVYAGPFNEFGHREYRIGVNTTAGVIHRTHTQAITKITPRYCELQVLAGGPISMSWRSKIGTGTVPKDVIYNLLIKQIKDRKNVNEYFDIISFYQQAGDYKRAKEELQWLEQNFPEQKDRIKDLRSENLQYQARQILREIEVRRAAGQTDLALQLVQAANKVGVAGQTLAQFEDIENTLKAIPEKLQATRTQVMDLIARLNDLDQGELRAVKRFEKELETELNEITEPRLSAFLRMSDVAEVDDEAKISLAISGWIRGSNFADENLAVTQDLFTTRDLVREYLTIKTSKERRQQILKELATLESGNTAFIDTIVKQMKPIAGEQDVSQYTGEKPIEFFIEIPGTKADPTPKRFRCLAHLPGRGASIEDLADGEVAPPQYNPYRKYPMILTLPGGAQSLEANLDTWCGNFNPRLNNRMGQAMRNGYIVVAVDWRSNGQSNWKYSGLEHKVVTEALYEALSRFSVDSDRVFISGHGRGADGAFDIGVSHPDLWAGVIGYSGKFGKYVNIYNDNTHVNLPMYVVNGQKDTVSNSTMMKSLTKWLRSKNKFNDVTLVQYSGRANEFFIEDIPDAFKWMRPHRRTRPDRNGFEFDCATFRPWDTFFWFYEMHGLPGSNTVPPALYDSYVAKKKFPPKLRLKGKLKLNSNEFYLEPRNLKIKADATLWLSPEYFDFAKPISISGRGRFKGPVKESVEVLLNDVRQRGDREHPFWAKVDCISGHWTPAK